MWVTYSDTPCMLFVCSGVCTHKMWVTYSDNTNNSQDVCTSGMWVTYSTECRVVDVYALKIMVTCSGYITAFPKKMCVDAQKK